MGGRGGARGVAQGRRMGVGKKDTSSAGPGGAVKKERAMRPSGRGFLHRASGGFGAVALAGLWAETQAADPLAARKGHFPARADRVIFLFSTGGVSHIDTFDHKPKLVADHGKSVTASRWLNKPGKFE